MHLCTDFDCELERVLRRVNRGLRTVRVCGRCIILQEESTNLLPGPFVTNTLGLYLGPLAMSFGRFEVQKAKMKETSNERTNEQTRRHCSYINIPDI